MSSVRPQKRSKKEEVVEEPPFEPTVIHHLNGIHAALNAMAQQMKDRNDLLAQSVAEAPEGEESAGGAVSHDDLDVIEHRLEGLEGIVHGHAKLMQRLDVIEEFSKTFAAKLDALEQFTGKVVGGGIGTNGEATAKKRGRPSNAEKAAREAAATEVAPVEEKVATPAEVREVVAKVEEKLAPAPATNGEVVIKEYLTAHPGAKATDLVRDLKLSLNRANAYITLWGLPAGAEQTPAQAVLEAVAKSPAAQHAAGTPEAIAAAQATTAAMQTVTAQAKVVETAPAGPPSVDDVRAVAITWIGRHGKEKFADVLKKYGATNLSSVAEEQRAGLMAELANGGK
jgi:hypothetical protein